MKKYEWKIELLNQIPLIAATSFFVFAQGYGYVLIVFLLYLSLFTGKDTWSPLWVLAIIALILILISLCFVRWWRPWLVGIPVQLAVYGCVWYIQQSASKWDSFAIWAGGALFCQAIALLIKTLIRRSKAKKAILESEVTEG